MRYITNRGVPAIQKMAQGRNGDRNAMTRNVQAARMLQPGNTMVRRVKIAAAATFGTP